MAGIRNYKILQFYRKELKILTQRRDQPLRCLLGTGLPSLHLSEESADYHPLRGRKSREDAGPEKEVIQVRFHSFDLPTINHN